MCGIARRHENRVSGREDEYPLVATNYGDLNLDGTEDDGDDAEQIARENQNLCCNFLTRKRCDMIMARPWMVSLLRRLGYRRAILQSDGEPSIVALNTATLLATIGELVLRQSPVGEHATNGVAESAIREVKSQTRTLNFALEAHVEKIVESHPIRRVIRCDQFLQDRQRWQDSGNALGRSSLQISESLFTSAQRSQWQLRVERNRSCMLVGILDTTHALATFSS